MTQQYIARMFDVTDSCILISEPHATREDAAKEAFNRMPHMNECTTTIIGEEGPNWPSKSTDPQTHRNPFPYSRIADAHNIWHGGACNVRGIARALVKAADSARADNVQPSEDLAVRAIVAQLASLCRVDNLGTIIGLDAYDALNKAYEESRAKVAA
jgi:hypothetical protein